MEYLLNVAYIKKGCDTVLWRLNKYGKDNGSIGKREQNCY